MSHEFQSSVARLEQEVNGQFTAASESHEARNLAWEQALEHVESMPRAQQLEVSLAEARKLEQTLDQEKDAQFRSEVEHTIFSVESAQQNLEKDGPNKGKLKVVIKDPQGNPLKHSDGTEMVQYEGVPVDGLADLLLRSSEQFAANLPAMATEAKQRYERMRREYDLQYAPGYEPKPGDVAVDPIELRKAERESQQLQRDAADPMMNAEVLRLRALAASLERGSNPYFDSHFGGHELSQNEVELRQARTEYEAFLISNDYRASHNPDEQRRMQEDYERAMRTMSQRRELILNTSEQPAVQPQPAETAATPENNAAELYNAMLQDMLARAYEAGYRRQQIDQERQRIAMQETDESREQSRKRSREKTLGDWWREQQIYGLSDAPAWAERAHAEFRGDAEPGVRERMPTSPISAMREGPEVARDRDEMAQLILLEHQDEMRTIIARLEQQMTQSADEKVHEALESGTVRAELDQTLAEYMCPQAAPQETAVVPAQKVETAVAAPEAVPGSAAAEAAPGVGASRGPEAVPAAQNRPAAEMLSAVEFVPRTETDPGNRPPTVDYWMPTHLWRKRKSALIEKITGGLRKGREKVTQFFEKIFELAQDARDYYRHSADLARVDDGTATDLQIAKKKVKTEANRRFIETRIQRARLPGGYTRRVQNGRPSGQRQRIMPAVGRIAAASGATIRLASRRKAA